MADESESDSDSVSVPPTSDEEEDICIKEELRGGVKEPHARKLEKMKNAFARGQCERDYQRRVKQEMNQSGLHGPSSEAETSKANSGMEEEPLRAKKKRKSEADFPDIANIVYGKGPEWKS